MIQDDRKWFEDLRASQSYKDLSDRPIAYFCAEYGISAKIPIYAGGLGILAADYVREAIEQQIPLLAIGLYYAKGFEGRETRKLLNPEEVGLLPVLDNDKNILTIAIPIQDHLVYFKAWKWQSGTVLMYLLDSHVNENTIVDQQITDQLYGMDREQRLKQEMALGIGGMRLIEKIGYHPSHYHLNEGHSAFLIFELISHQMREHNLSFEQAKEITRERVLYTNHTLLPAGNDTFSNDLVALVMDLYAKEIKVPVQTLVEMGLVQQSSTFSMSLLAMRAAGKINTVSKLHSKKAAEIWKDHPMFPITNGINLKEWDKIVDIDRIWQIHLENKIVLLKEIEMRTGEKWDPNTLLIGWARRMVGYKRPLAIVERLMRFLSIANNTERPVRLVYAGNAHPADSEGKDTLAELKYRIEKDLKGVAVYLDNYDIDLSKKMISGCDIWANTPVVGFEACGTSGIKAALNGVLPLTTRDGWVDEVELYKIGWLLDDANITEDILEKLEHEILPIYYEKDNNQIPNTWVAMMKNARSLIYNDFSMTRVLRQYLTQGMGINP